MGSEKDDLDEEMLSEALSEDDSETEVAEAAGTFEEDLSSIYTTKDVDAFMQLILLHFSSLTVYVIDPYIEQNTGEALKIPAGDNYTIYDHGGRLVVTPNDIFATPFFACGGFLAAIEQLLQMVVDIHATEIAVLGDQRGKLFAWDRCDRLRTIQNIPINVINFSPSEAFINTRETVLNYLRQHGMTPKVLSKPTGR